MPYIESPVWPAVRASAPWATEKTAGVALAA